MFGCLFTYWSFGENIRASCEVSLEPNGNVRAATISATGRTISDGTSNPHPSLFIFKSHTDLSPISWSQISVDPLHSPIVWMVLGPGNYTDSCRWGTTKMTTALVGVRAFMLDRAARWPSTCRSTISGGSHCQPKYLCGSAWVSCVSPIRWCDFLWQNDPTKFPWVRFDPLAQLPKAAGELFGSIRHWGKRGQRSPCALRCASFFLGPLKDRGRRQ